MQMTRRKMMTMAIGAGLLLAGSGLPAWAGHEADNLQGKYNGRYKAVKIRITEKDKEEVILKKVTVELHEEKMQIFIKDATINTKVDQIYSMGWKLEVSCHDSVSGISYFVIIEGNFE